MEDIYASQNTVIASLHREADVIQAYIQQPLTLEDPAALTVRLSHMDVYMARLSDIMIRAKTMKEREKNSYIAQNEAELNKLTATISNRKIDAYLQEHTALYNRLDAMYHTMEHLTRDLVTQISYIKQQMQTHC